MPAVLTQEPAPAQFHIYGADHETGDEAPADEQLNWPSGFVRLPDGTIYVSECRSARIRVIAPDRKSFRFITSPAMKHAATIAVVEAEASHAPSSDRDP